MKILFLFLSFWTLSSELCERSKLVKSLDNLLESGVPLSKTVVLEALSIFDKTKSYPEVSSFLVLELLSLDQEFASKKVKSTLSNLWNKKNTFACDKALMKKMIKSGTNPYEEKVSYFAKKVKKESEYFAKRPEEFVEKFGDFESIDEELQSALLDIKPSYRTKVRMEQGKISSEIFRILNTKKPQSFTKSKYKKQIQRLLKGPLDYKLRELKELIAPPKIKAKVLEKVVLPGPPPEKIVLSRDDHEEELKKKRKELLSLSPQKLEEIEKQVSQVEEEIQIHLKKGLKNKALLEKFLSFIKEKGIVLDPNLQKEILDNSLERYEALSSLKVALKLSNNSKADFLEKDILFLFKQLEYVAHKPAPEIVEEVKEEREEIKVDELPAQQKEEDLEIVHFLTNPPNEYFRTYLQEEGKEKIILDGYVKEGYQTQFQDLTLVHSFKTPNLTYVKTIERGETILTSLRMDPEGNYFYLLRDKKYQKTPLSLNADQKELLAKKVKALKKAREDHFLKVLECSPRNI